MSDGTRKLEIVTQWALWYAAAIWFWPGFAGFYPLMERKFPFQPWYVLPGSVVLLLIGSHHLARLGVSRFTCIVYGACGGLLILIQFVDLLKYGLWYKPEFSVLLKYGIWSKPKALGLIVIQWISFTVLMGAISAGIVVSVARRRDAINKSDQSR